MSTKAFIVSIVAALFFGGVVAGAFIVGTFVGKGQAEESQFAEAGFVAPRREPSPADVEVPAEVRQAIAEAGVQMDDQQRQQLRDQLRAQLGQGGAGALAGGLGALGGGVVGTITAVEGSKLTVETPGGVMTVMVGDETSVQRIAEIGAEELEAGSRIAVSGSRDESGAMDAQSITVVPEGVDFPVGPGRGGSFTRPDGGRGGAGWFGGQGGPSGQVEEVIVITNP